MRGTNWSDIEKDRLKELYFQHTIPEISHIMQRPAKSIRNTAYKMKLIKNNHPTYDFDFFKKWSSNMAYVLGFITSDGCVHGNKLQIGINPKDISVLEFIREQIAPLAKISFYSVFDVRTNNTYNTSKLVLYSKEIVQDLISLGVTYRKTGQEIFPNNIPKDYISDYVRGLFDGDGTVYIEKDRVRASICSASLSFLESIQKNLPVRSHINKNGNIFDLRINRQDDVKAFYYFMYHNEGFYLDRKKKTFINHYGNKDNN